MSEQNNVIIMLRDVRLSFPDIWRPYVNKDGTPGKFGGKFIMPPDHPVMSKLRDAIAEVANAKWGAKGPEMLKALIASDRVCLHNGDTKADQEGYAGNWFVSANSKVQPAVFAPDGKTKLTEAGGKPYSGCFVNAQIDVWAQDNANGKRINAQLRGLQFLRDGDAFGGGSVSQPDEFEEVEGASADADAPGVPAGDNPWGDDPAAGLV